MNILIVTPRFIDAPCQTFHFPLGLSYISACLKQHGCSVENLNLNFHFEPLCEILEEHINKSKIDIICTGGLSVHYNQVKQIIDTAKHVKPNIISVVGGGLITSEPELMMQALGINYGVIGEGEITIVELADALKDQNDPGNINGIIYLNREDAVIKTPSRKQIDDLDSIPWPDYESIDMEAFLSSQKPASNHYSYHFEEPREIPIVASRSCPYRCTFCFHPLGNKYRQRSLDNIFREIGFLIKKYRVNTFTIMDEVFAVRGSNMERIEEFCTRIKQYGVRWIANLRVDGVDKHLLRMMKDSGCFYIGYGLESASETVLKSMKKQITLPQIEKALRETFELNLGIQANLIFGDPAETVETVKESLQWYSKHPQYQVNLAMIQLYPGSENYNLAVNRGLVKDKIKFISDVFPLTNISNLTEEQYKELCKLIIDLPTKHMVFAKKTTCRQTGVLTFTGDIFSLDIECPYCGELVNYVNMNRPSGYGRLNCKECNSRFLLPREALNLASKNYHSAMRNFILNIFKNISLRKFDIAETNIQDSIRKFPKNAELYIQLGDLYSILDKHELAEKSYSQCLEIDPNSLRCVLKLALLAQNHGRMDKAEKLYKKAIQYFPNNRELRISIGKLYLDMGLPHNTKKAFQKALALEPFHKDCQNIALEISKL